MDKSKIKAVASDLYIPNSAARLISGSTQRARPEIPAVEAKPAVKDKDGNIVTKAVKALPSVPARKSCSYMKIAANNSTFMNELVNRMAMEGVFPKENAEIEPHITGVSLIFVHENQAAIRIALKKAKGAGANNAKGKAIFDADQKLKAAKAAETKKEKEAKSDDGSDKEKGAKASAKSTKKLTSKKAEKQEKEDSDEWPEE